MLQVDFSTLMYPYALCYFISALENIVSITATSSSATAGESFTLVCNVTSKREAKLSWIDPNGVTIEDGNYSGWSDALSPQELTLRYSGWSNEISTLELTFPSIRTSQSGVYKCISDIVIPPFKSEASFSVQVQSKSAQVAL